jgi:uncharacterized PurR-regulated membrane protein YhhQ (DUF165 family)
MAQILNHSAVMDRWILPSRQSDVPGRDLVADEILHGRREGTFLALVTLYLVATLAVPLFAARRVVIDLGDVLNIDPLQLSLGVLMFPIAICAAQLVCELYSSRRAGALVLAGALASFAIVGVDGGDGLLGAVALVACTTIAQAANVLVFSAARAGTRGRKLGLRIVLAAGLSQLLGWSAFMIVLGVADTLTDTAVATAVTACAYIAAASVAVALPLVLVRRWIATYLRVGRCDDDLVVHHVHHAVYARKLPPALIVDDEPELLHERPFRPALHPFSTGEMEFFAEGDALADVADYS